MWLIVGALGALAIGYVLYGKAKADALALLDFAPYTVKKGALFRLTFLSSADEAPETVNQWLQQNWYLAPQGLPTKIRTGISLKGPAEAFVDEWEVSAVPMWPAFTTPQIVTPQNYFSLLLTNLYPAGPPAGLQGPRGLAAILFMAATGARDVPERKTVIFIGARPLER